MEILKILILKIILSISSYAMRFFSVFKRIFHIRESLIRSLRCLFVTFNYPYCICV